MGEHPPEKDAAEEKWSFEDYAYTITGIIVGILIAGPIVLDTLLQIIFNLEVFDGILGDEAPGILDWLDARDGGLRFLSPLLFLVTITIVWFKDAFDARKNGEYSGSWFTHDFASLFEDAIYMALTTIILFSSILFGTMWASWLAAPISFLLFVFIFPLFAKKGNTVKSDEIKMPWVLLLILALGVIAEAITRAWLAFPLSWLVICAIEFINSIRKAERSLDTVFDISYNALSVVVMSAGVFLSFWITSWVALPVALFICWIFSKFKRFKKPASPPS